MISVVVSMTDGQSSRCKHDNYLSLRCKLMASNRALAVVLSHTQTYKTTFCYIGLKCAIVIPYFTSLQKSAVHGWAPEIN